MGYEINLTFWNIFFCVSLMVIAEYGNMSVVNMKYIKECDMSLSCRKSAEIASADTLALEAEIDEKVFDLYGLTSEEREIVKGGGK